MAISSRVIAVHPGGELDTFAVTNDGRFAALVWNIGGSSLLEIMDLASGKRRRVSGGPDVIERVRLSADARELVASGHGPCLPRTLWRLSSGPEVEAADLALVEIDSAHRPLPDQHQLVTPSREVVYADDGLTIEGWLYQPRGV